MSRILIVGATGQLGMAAAKLLLARGASVRALARSPESASRLQSLGAETVIGDLTQPESLASACDGVTVVIATANSAIPTRSTDNPATVEGTGYRNLLDAAEMAGVRRIIYTSVPHSPNAHRAEFFRAKFETEHRIREGPFETVIFRCDVFMDVAFAMMGTEIPVRGADNATVGRSFGFSANHFARIRDSIERKRVAMIPGNGTTRHTFICIADVAQFLAAAATGGPPGIHEIGGPEALTYLDVVRLYETLLGYSLKVEKTPAWLFRGIASLMRPFHRAGSNLMQLNYVGAIDESIAGPAAAKLYGIQLTSAAQFLREKHAIPAA